MPDFLLEIGCEEIPARMIDAASLELRERVHKLLERERLLPAGALTYLDTPRRLAVLAANIPAAQPDVIEQVTGPSVERGFQRRPAHSGRACLRQESRRGCFAVAARHHPEGRVPVRARHEEGAHRRRDSGRGAAQGNRLHLLAQEHVLAQARASASCARCAGWWRCSMARSFRWSSMAFAPETSRADIEFWPTGRSQFPGPAPLCRGAGEGQGPRPRAAGKADSQGSRRCDSHHSRRALARRQVAARHGGQSDRMAVGDSGQLRSGISGVAGRSSGHGDARSSEIFCGRGFPGQPFAAFSGGAEHRRRSATASSGTATSACCAPASTTPASSGRPTRSIRCASGRHG